jgi:bloom syndrome protein
MSANRPKLSFELPPTPSRAARAVLSSSKKRPAPPPTPTKSSSAVIELGDSDGDEGEYFAYDDPVALDDDEIQITGGASSSSAVAKGKGRATGTVTYGAGNDPAGEFADLPASAFDLDMSDDIVPLAEAPLSSKGRRRPPPSDPPPAYDEVTTVAGPSRPSGGVARAASGASNAASRGFNHPWSRECLSVLSKTFHLRSFRPNQVEAINGTLSGRDVFVLMPTGGGKSLCYQLPSQVHGGKTSGITIIVSPLLSLINDQVEHLRSLGIPAIPFTGDLPAADKKRAMQFLNGGVSGADSVDGAVVYVTPEMLGKSPTFQSLLRSVHRKGKLARFVIDECHVRPSLRSRERGKS